MAVLAEPSNEAADDRLAKRNAPVLTRDGPTAVTALIFASGSIARRPEPM
jgi:hypothetical protein